jgi:hypothetical protein
LIINVTCYALTFNLLYTEEFLTRIETLLTDVISIDEEFKVSSFRHLLRV